MPIRFRCAYCNQLMGISTRKAGTVVKCPKCAGDIIVPTPEGEAAAPEPLVEPPGEQAGSAGGAFEEKEFEQYFHEAADGSAAATAAPTEAAVPDPAPAPAPPLEPPPPPPRRGLFLALPMLFLSLAVVILLLIAMFVVGFLLGRHAARPDEAAHALAQSSQSASASHALGT